MARIVTVYDSERTALGLEDMGSIRWLKISESLARRGHRVEMAVTGGGFWSRARTRELAPNLTMVPIRQVDWARQDVVKTLFHAGFETLERYGGSTHPFIIAKVGSVVGPRDQPGIYFYGRMRHKLYETQARIDRAARYVSVLSEPARKLWAECHGAREILLVPGAVDREIPAAGPDPYPMSGVKRCLFAGNVYGPGSQPEANAAILSRLNALGERLEPLGVRLFLLGPGNTTQLDPQRVSYLGVVPYPRSWDFLHHADVGIVVAAGAFMHNNESTKIYHYLRAGLPVVSEEGFPNDDVVRRSGLGFVVPNGDPELMSRRVAEAAHADWDVQRAIEFVREHHSWDQRAGIYDAIIRRHFPE